MSDKFIPKTPPFANRIHENLKRLHNTCSCNNDSISAPVYLHYKKRSYWIIGEALNTPSVGEPIPVIIYEDSDGQVWVRNKDEFHGEVAPGVKRFQLINVNQVIEEPDYATRLVEKNPFLNDMMSKLDTKRKPLEDQADELNDHIKNINNIDKNTEPSDLSDNMNKNSFSKAFDAKIRAKKRLEYRVNVLSAIITKTKILAGLIFRNNSKVSIERLHQYHIKIEKLLNEIDADISKREGQDAS